MAAEGVVPLDQIEGAVGFNGAAAGWPRKEHGRLNVAKCAWSFNGAAAGWPRKAYLAGEFC